MGNQTLVQCTPNEDSPTMPGQKSVVSAPFPDNIRMEDFWEELKKWLQHPVDPLMAAVLKSCVVTEHAPDDFTVKVVLDGKKLDSYGYGKGDGTDKLAKNIRTKMDWDKKTIISQCYKMDCWVGEEEGDETVYSVFTSVYFQATPPIAFECWMDWKGPAAPGYPSPARRADETTAGIVTAVNDPICKRLSQTKVFLAYDVDSPSGKGKSVMSPPFNEHTDYDTFWPALLGLLKQPNLPGQEIIEVSETQFRREYEQPGGGGEKIVNLVTINEKAGEVEEVVTRAGNFISTYFRKVHRDPLRYEAWTVNDASERLSDRMVGNVFQEEFNMALKKTASWFW